MSTLRVIDLYPHLTLPDPVLADVISHARETARLDRDATLLDCPFNWCAPSDRFWRQCRAAWRFAFRELRESIDGAVLAGSTQRGVAANPAMQRGRAPSGSETVIRSTR
jgi:hypothetical protein